MGATRARRVSTGVHAGEDGVEFVGYAFLLTPRRERNRQFGELSGRDVGDVGRLTGALSQLDLHFAAAQEVIQVSAIYRCVGRTAARKAPKAAGCGTLMARATLPTSS